MNKPQKIAVIGPGYTEREQLGRALADLIVEQVESQGREPVRGLELPPVTGFRPESVVIRAE